MAYPASWNQEVDECAKIVNGNALWSWIYAVDAIFVEESDKNNSLIMIYVGKEEKMQKTKLGISVGTLCAAIYFTGIFGGYFTAVFLAGYVLLVENNEWLRKNAVKAIVLMIIFSIVTAIINLIPDAISCVEHIMSAIKDRVSMYQAIDMANAESSEKKAYKENLEKINNLVAAKDKNYKAIKKAFSKMDQTVYMYIDPENVLDISIQQVDASDFPKVKLYLNIQDENTGNVPSGLDDTSFYVLKKDATANYVKQKVKAISQLNEQEALKVDMVADVSGSMSGTPLSEAQMCMANFVNSMQFDAGDQVELTSFATGVRLEQEFTGDASSLIDEINDLVTGDMTSLYDALYTAVERVATQSGARCVIAFTDGNDNYSDCSVTDVVNVANRYHVPVFIIGIGSVDTTDLYTITNQTGGEYYNINAVNSMQEIYEKIYRMEKQLYMVEFEDGTGADINDQSDIKTGYKSVKYGGECNYTYTPNVLLSAGSATLYKDGPEAVVEEYLKNFDDAVNHSDFSLISNCLQKGSPIYTEQEKYVQRDISEQLDSYELTDVSYSDENNCVISTRETYYVQVSGEALQLMTQECKYSLVKENGNWFMTSFVDINVVSRIKQ